MWEAAPSHLHRDWVSPAGCGAQPWLQNTWGLKAAQTILFQPCSSPVLAHTAPIHPVQQWSRRVTLSPHPPGASLLPTFRARTTAITRTPTVMFWHHQSPLPACTTVFHQGLLFMLSKTQRKKRAQSSIAHCPLSTVPQGLATFLQLTAGFKIT